MAVHGNALVAAVVLTHGRYFLTVGGLYVAMEGDICRDPSWAEKVWDKTMLDEAASKINGSVYTIGMR